MGEVGQLYISIGARMDEALAALAKVRQELKGVEGSTKSAEDKFKKFAETCKATGQQFKDFGKPLMLAGAAITGAFAIAIKKTADLGDEFKDLSQRTGIAVETLSGFKLAADKSGTSIEGFATGMRGLSRVMADAAGGGKETREAFDSIGVSVTDVAGNLRPLEEVMLDVADKFAAMPDGAEKSALAMKLFGKSGAELIPMLNMGKKGLEENAAQMRKFGIVTREEAEAGDAFNDAMTDLGAATGGLSRAIAGTLIPALTKLATGMADVVAKVSAWAREHKGLTTVLAGGTFAIGAVATVLGTLAFGIGTVLTQLPKFILGLKAMGITLGTLQGGFAALISPIGLATAGIVALLIAIAPGDNIIEKFGAVISTTIDTIGKWARMIQEADAIFTQSWFVRGFKSDVTQQIAAAKNEVTAFAASLKVLKPPMQEMQNAIEWGPKNWALYKDEISRTDKILAANKDTIVAWLDKGFAWLGLTKDMAGGANALGEALKSLGIKGKTELTAELEAAERALTAFKASAESTPGQVKALEDKIVALKEAMSGVKVETKSLAEQLGLLVRVDMEKKYRDMLTALTAYKGKLTDEGEKKLIEDLIKLRAELDNTKPSVVSLDEVLKGVDETIANLFTEGELADISAGVGAVADQMQRDFEEAAKGTVDAILSMAPSAELMELKFKTIGDAMGVSANTVKVACWNIQADFLRTIGIIVPKIQSLASTTKSAFETLSDDMAKAFGEAFATIIKDGLTLKNFFNSLFQGIVNAAATYIGGELTKTFKDAFDGIKSASVAMGLAVVAGFASIVYMAYQANNKALAAAERKDLIGYWTDQMKAFGKITEATVDKLAELAEKYDALGFSIKKTGAVMADTGVDLSNFNAYLEEMTANANKLNANLPNVTMSWGGAVPGIPLSAEEAAAELSDQFEQILAAAKKFGKEGSKSMLDFILATRAAGVEVASLMRYQQEQLSTIPAALSTLIAGVGKSASAVKNLGTIALTSFNAMTASGMSFFDALQAMKEPLAALRDKYKELGLAADPALNKLLKLAGIAGKNKELFDSIQANKTIMEALGNSGFMTASALKAIAKNANDYYLSLQKAGMSSKDALRAMAPTLQQIYDYAKAYSITLDANTKKLIEEAKAAGIVKDKVDIGTVLTTVNDTLDKIYKLWCKIFHVVDETADRAGDIDYPDDGGGGGKGDGGREPAAAGWEGYLPRNKPFLAHAGEYVKVWPARQVKGKRPVADFAGLVAKPLPPLVGKYGLTMPAPIKSMPPTPSAGGPQGPVNVTFNVNAIDRAGVESFLRNDAKPILQGMLDHYDLTVRTGGVRG